MPCRAKPHFVMQCCEALLRGQGCGCLFLLHHDPWKKVRYENAKCHAPAPRPTLRPSNQCPRWLAAAWPGSETKAEKMVIKGLTKGFHPLLPCLRSSCSFWYFIPPPNGLGLDDDRPALPSWLAAEPAEGTVQPGKRVLFFLLGSSWCALLTAVVLALTRAAGS